MRSEPPGTRTNGHGPLDPTERALPERALLAFHADAVCSLSGPGGRVASYGSAGPPTRIGGSRSVGRSRARQTLAARQNPEVRAALADAFARFSFADPDGELLNAIARYPLDADPFSSHPGAATRLSAFQLKLDSARSARGFDVHSLTAGSAEVDTTVQSVAIGRR